MVSKMYFQGIEYGTTWSGGQRITMRYTKYALLLRSFDNHVVDET